MKTNKRTLKLLSAIVASTLLMPTMITKADSNIIKEETVYVNLNHDGNVNDKLSSIWIHSNLHRDPIIDTSTLKNLVNIKNDDEPNRKNNEVVWDTKGKDIYYQGEPIEELPLEINVKYSLEGKDVNPQSIVGESGRLEMKIEIVNKDKFIVKTKNNTTRSIYTPYLIATVVDLPTDKFTNITINTGKLISDGSRQIVSNISLPGIKESLGIEKELKNIPDDLIITADVEDFEMGSIMFAATSEIPEIDGLESAQDLIELMDGLKGLGEASEKLVEATEKIYLGQKDLNFGVGKLVDGTGELAKGSEKLLRGSSDLNRGLNSAYEGSKQIRGGADELSSGAKELGQGFSDLGEGTLEFGNKAIEFAQGAAQIAQGVSSIPGNTKALEAGMNNVISVTKSLQKGQEDLSVGLDQSIEALKEIRTGKEKESKVVSLLLKATDGLDLIADKMDKLPGLEELASKMKTTLQGQREALLGMENSSHQLIEALEQVEVGLTQAQTASNQLAQGTKGLNEGQKQINSGLIELANGSQDLIIASDQLSQGSKGLQEGATRINENAKIAKIGASKFAAGAMELSYATQDLSGGLGQLNEGAGELQQGISQLDKGTRELFKGGEEVKVGSGKLLEGSMGLNEAMNMFNDEGIKRITDELNNNDLDLEDLMERKDDLVKLSKENKSFSGISKDMEGKLKFIMKTESVKKEQFMERPVIDNTQKVVEDKGFINWLKTIFKKKS